MFRCSPKEFEIALHSRKKLKYDIVFVADMPAFYRIALYNKLSEKYKILVVFLREGESSRNADFHKGKCLFDCVRMPGSEPFSPDDSLRRLLSKANFSQFSDLYRLWKKISFERIFMFGWGEPASWMLALLSPRRKNCVVVESSIMETRVSGLRGLVKRLFLKRIGSAYCSGSLQKKLVEALGFKGKVVITHGVGLYRRVPQPAYSPRNPSKNLIFVGRLVWQKNLEFLLKCVSKRPEITLHIAGFGPLEDELKRNAPPNTVFYGAVDNENLPKLYSKMDAFVLPSCFEAWGLVVEEALNNGLPVLLSDRVGCSEDLLEDGKNGFSFEFSNESDFLDKLDRIFDPDTNNAMRKFISERNPEDIENAQIGAY